MGEGEEAEERRRRVRGLGEKDSGERRVVVKQPDLRADGHAYNQSSGEATMMLVVDVTFKQSIFVL